MKNVLNQTKRHWLKITGVVVAAAAASIVTVSAISLAQDPKQDGFERFGRNLRGAFAQEHGHGKGHHHGFRLFDRGEQVEVLAETLDMSVEELKKAHQAGQTLRDIAEAQSVAWETVTKALYRYC